MLKTLTVAASLAAFIATGASAADVVVSSKIDTEGTLLGNIILLSLNAAGIKAQDRIALGTTPVLRKAITSGEIDIYAEYTGNAGFFFNKADDAAWKSSDAGYALAKKLDYDANKIVWLTPSPANNTWAVAVRNDVAGPNKLKTMSDFGKWISGGGKVKLAASSEFVNSAAALPAFRRPTASRSALTRRSFSPEAIQRPPSRLPPTRPMASTPPWSMARTALSKLPN